MGISVEGANKRFGDFQALDDVAINVPDGSLTALLGPSGSGKSTLLRAIAGLEDLDSGRVIINDEDATGKPAQKRGVGFVFQHYAAFKHMTVFDNVAFGLKIRSKGKPAIEERVNSLLALVHLDGRIGREPRADQLDSGFGLDQDRPAGHERTEDQVAEAFVLGDELAELLHRDLDHLALVADDSGEVDALPGQHAELAEEALGPVDGDDPVLGSVALDDHHRARLDDEEVALGVALGEEDVAGLDVAELAELPQLSQLVLVEARVGAVAVWSLRQPGADRLSCAALGRFGGH
jgi:hypothetical protein